MQQQYVRLVITVTSTNGGPWQHVYVLPEDLRQRDEIVNEINKKIALLDQSTGVIYLPNPSAVYSVKNIVRFGWTLSHPSQQEADEVERQLGLNIPR